MMSAGMLIDSAVNHNNPSGVKTPATIARAMMPTNHVTERPQPSNRQYVTSTFPSPMKRIGAKFQLAKRGGPAQPNDGWVCEKHEKRRQPCVTALYICQLT